MRTIRPKLWTQNEAVTPALDKLVPRLEKFLHQQAGEIAAQIVKAYETKKAVATGNSPQDYDLEGARGSKPSGPKTVCYTCGATFAEHKGKDHSFVDTVLGHPGAAAKVAKAKRSQTDQILAELELSGWSVIVEDLGKPLEDVARQAGADALAQLRISDEGLTELVDDNAVDWASDHAAALVGMRWVDDELVPNPSPLYAITDSTRDMLRSTVETAVEEGWSSQRLRDHLIDNYAFSPQRAETIGRTELAFAHSQGNLIAMKDSGVVKGKSWDLNSTHDLDDECDSNAEQGIIDIDDDFDSDDDAPPAHPNCECVLLFYTDEEMPDKVLKADEPKVGRDAFLYLDPDPGEEQQWAQCSECVMYTSAIRRRCTIHGPSVDVGPGDSCGLFVGGEPAGAAVETKARVTAEQSGLVDRQVRCENCRFFDADASTCGLFETLNDELGDMFELEIVVDPRGCCNAQTPDADEAAKFLATVRLMKSDDQPQDEQGPPQEVKRNTNEDS